MCAASRPCWKGKRNKKIERSARLDEIAGRALLRVLLQHFGAAGWPGEKRPLWWVRTLGQSKREEALPFYFTRMLRE